jgi:hypothetical protein
MKVRSGECSGRVLVHRVTAKEIVNNFLFFTRGQAIGS